MFIMPDGEEVTDTDMLVAGMVIVGSKNGQPFKGRSSTKTKSMALGVPPPRSVSGGGEKKPPVIGDPCVGNGAVLTSGGTHVVLNQDAAMLAQLRAAIQRAPGFREVGVDSCPTVTVFDYDDDTKFPADVMADPLLMECRGLWVCTATHRVLARRFAKFFETSPGPEEEVVRVVEKYDGTLVAPVMVTRDGPVVWTSRRQVVSVDTGCDDFVVPMLRAGLTPLFEYCTATHPVGVLTYPASQLVLLAVRDNATGVYVGWDAHPSVRVAHTYAVEDLPSVFASTLMEGVVVYARNTRTGALVLHKVKTRWYKDMVQGLRARAREPGLLRRFMVNKHYSDRDIPPAWALDAELADATSTTHGQMLALQNDLVQWVTCVRHRSAQTFDIRSALAAAGWPPGVITQLLVTSGSGLTEALVGHLHDLLRTGQLRLVQSLLLDQEPGGGADGDTSSSPTPTPRHIVDFRRQAIAATRDHVVAVYAPVKLHKIAGDDGKVCFRYGYAPSEGKLHGMHEAFVAFGVVDLRVDVQPVGGATERVHPRAHFGTHDYVLVLVQCEAGVAPPRPPTVNLAGVYVPVNVPFSVGTVVAGLQRSLDMDGANVVLPRVSSPGPPGGTRSRTIFCDLDGVLVGESSSPSFEERPWAFGGREVWAAVCAAAAPGFPQILTAMPTCVTREEAGAITKQKRAWVARELGPAVPVIVCAGTEKYKQCTPGTVLVDDTARHGPRWTSHGGTFVWHVRPQRTVFELQRLNLTRSCPPENENLDADADPPFVEVKMEVEVEVEVVPGLTDDECVALGPVVGVDCEWAAGSTGVSILQLASVAKVAKVAKVVKVIDTRGHYGGCVPDNVRRLVLTNPLVVKVMFAPGLQDARRLGTDIVNVVDIQDVAGFASSVGLRSAVRAVLGLTLPKPKHLTLYDWDARPMAPEAIEYAARDASVLLDLWAALGSPPGTDLAMPVAAAEGCGGPTTLAASSDLRPGSVCKMLFWEYALADASAAALRRAVPQRLTHKAECALHVVDVVGSSAPPHPSYCSALGQVAEFTVDAVFRDAQVQVARVTPGHMHVLMSHALPSLGAALVRLRSVKGGQGGGPWVPLPRPVVVTGRRCAVVKTPCDPLADLSPAVKGRILQFCDQVGAAMGGEEEKTTTTTTTMTKGAALQLEAEDLTAEQRALVHEFAARVGLHSQSDGRPRRLTLTKTTKTCRPGPGTTKLDRLFQDRTCVVTDPSVLGMICVVDDAGDGACAEEDMNAGPDRSGPATLDASMSHTWSAADFHLGRASSGPGTLVVLRGLPDSGKSTIVRALERLADGSGGCVVVSADATMGAVPIAKAHDLCEEAVYAAMCRGEPLVVVDNTNVRRHEVSRYFAMARMRAYKIVVVELTCGSAGLAIEFQRRCVHGVKFDTAMAMYHRFQPFVPAEEDGDVVLIRVQPWRKPSGGGRETVVAWLTKRGYLSHTPCAGATHLVMATGVGRMKFVCIPHNPDTWREFFEAYACDTGPKFFMDAVEEHGSFRFFMDLDNVAHEDGLSAIQDILRETADHLAAAWACNVVVSWCTDDDKVGVHINTDRVVYGKEDACLRADEVYSLTGLPFPDDRDVYTRGMRMYGSRKTTHGVDCGREYTVLYAAGAQVHNQCTTLEHVLWWTSLAPL
jgi:hypothetical protein